MPNFGGDSNPLSRNGKIACYSMGMLPAQAKLTITAAGKLPINSAVVQTFSFRPLILSHLERLNPTNRRKRASMFRRPG